MLDRAKELAKRWGTGFLLFMMVAVDSVSQIISTITDGLLAAGILLVLAWSRKDKKKE